MSEAAEKYAAEMQKHLGDGFCVSVHHYKNDTGDSRLYMFEVAHDSRLKYVATLLTDAAPNEIAASVRLAFDGQKEHA